MSRFLLLLVCASLAGAAPRPGGRVLLVSLDAMGYQRWTADPISAELTALKKVARAGVTARGVQPHFPSTTANSHAAIWTGAYGNVNGISANQNPATPRAGHAFTDHVVGFRADSLGAEPIWAAAARQGVKAVAYQATQAYPFLPVNTAPGAPVPPTVINGYQTKKPAPWALVQAQDAGAESCANWPRAAVQASRCYTWLHGPFRLHAATGRQGLWIAADPARDRVLVKPAAEETDLPRRRPLARHFSEGLKVGANLLVHFRLFALAPDGSDFQLLVSPVHELGFYNGTPDAGRELAAMLDATGAFVGNGPLDLLRDGLLGKRVTEGGSGIAERRFLEATEFVVRQNVRQTVWLWRRYAPRLMTGYLNYPDEIDHLMLGLVHPETPGVDAGMRAAYQGFRRWGYVILNRALESITALPSAEDSIVFTSDHGMAPVWKHVQVDAVLKQAGLDGKAKHVYNFLVLNTDDWKGGTIPAAEREQYADRAQAALEAVRDPESGEPVFRHFARPGRDGDTYGIGGPTGGDLYWDLAPGYYFTDAAGVPIVSRLSVPAGNHGFLPVREDMLAICIARGPRLPKGREWPRLKSIDIAPLVADLLGIGPPAQARGRSPLR